MQLKITVNRGEPTRIEVDGTRVFATSVVISYKVGEAPKVIMESYIQDAEGKLLREPGEAPRLETRVFGDFEIVKGN